MHPDELGLPVNLDAERFVLASLITTRISIPDISGAISADDFSLEKHRRIFRCMAAIHEHGERVDRVTVANDLIKRGQLESCDGLTYLASLDDGLPAIENIDSYCRIVRDKAILRRTIMGCRALMDRCLLAQDDPGDVLADAERFMRDTAAESNRASEMQTFAEILEECGGLNGIATRPVPGIPLAWPGLQRISGGIRHGQLWVLAARPSAGKSAMAMQQAAHAAGKGHRTAVFSLEMGATQLLHRVIADKASVDSRSIRDGRLTALDRHEVQRAAAELSNLPLWLNTSARTWAQMYALLRKSQARVPVDLAIVDHLHLLRGNSKSENRNQELGRITAEMKLAAKELNIGILLLAQLNRGSEKESRRPEMRDLRDSGEIEANADVILFLHPKEQVQRLNEKPLAVPVDLLVAKDRDGVRFVEVPMLLFGKYSRLVECEKERDVA